ncbi:PulJ/GspJ family protein [Cupriavidus campinensis]
MKRATSSERRRQPGRGFTLLEMLVAITLLAVMAVIGWRAIDSLTRSRERLTDHDARLDALKVLYGQFQSDCEHLANPSPLQASPVEFAPNQVLLVRDRRDEGQPTSWQVVVYRIDGGTLVRMASQPATSRNDIQAAMVNLRQAGAAGAQVRPLLGDAAQMSARVWVEPAGWQADNSRVRAALMQQGAADRAAAAAAAGASDAQAGLGNIDANATLRALELTVLARMGDGDAPRQFQKICMTGL